MLFASTLKPIRSKDTLLDGVLDPLVEG